MLASTIIKLAAAAVVACAAGEALAQPLFKELQVDRMYSAIDVPYHDGALAYFKEKSIKEVH